MPDTAPAATDTMPEPSANPSRREAARLRKQRSRERARARAAATAAANATRIEAFNEHLAPEVLRNPIVGRDGTVVRGPLLEIVNDRPVRALPLGAPGKGNGLASLQRSSVFGERHVTAARLLQQDFAEVGSGVNAGAVDLLGAGGGSGDGVGKHTAVLCQIEARRRLESALVAMNVSAVAVTRTVIDCVPIGTWTATTGVTPEEGLQVVAGGLSALAEFYWPDYERPGNGRIRTTYFATTVSGR